jgi:hypothetical protein
MVFPLLMQQMAGMECLKSVTDAWAFGLALLRPSGGAVGGQRAADRCRQRDCEGEDSFLTVVQRLDALKR